jgi:ankyrin repeat protein
MDPVIAFIEAATWHGTLEPAEAILAAYPEVAGANIHTAAITGDDAAVRRFIAQDPKNVTAKSPPYGGDALNYLGLSKCLRLDPKRSDGFLRAARALLDAGADPNTGFWTQGPYPEFETALYGAAGVAHHAGMTRLLLERGADPNDEEALYHSPESYDNDCVKLLVETGRITADNLSLMLIRKHDWHDYDGAKWLLEHGADPNLNRNRGWRPMHHALARDNSLAIIALLLDHGADPTLAEDGLTAIAMAAREGRSDVLELFEQRGIPIELHGVDRLIAACARGDATAARAIADREPDLVVEIKAMGGDLLAKFAGTDNPPGVARLLDLGVDVAAPFTEGDGYHDEPKHASLEGVAFPSGYAEIDELLRRHRPRP